MYNSPNHPHQPQPPAPPPYYAPNPGTSHAPTPVTHPATQASADNRARVAAIALFGATGLILIAALTKAWFTAGHSGGVGLLGLEKCRGAICESATWFDMKRIPSQIPIFATTALIASLAAVAFLVHTGVMLLQNRLEAIKLKLLSQLLALTSFGMIAFVFSLSFGDWSRGLSVGWSTFVGIGGLIGAAVITASMIRPLTAKR
jgi:hypothetical protein